MLEPNAIVTEESENYKESATDFECDNDNDDFDNDDDDSSRLSENSNDCKLNENQIAD